MARSKASGDGVVEGGSHNGAALPVPLPQRERLPMRLRALQHVFCIANMLGGSCKRQADRYKRLMADGQKAATHCNLAQSPQSSVSHKHHMNMPVYLRQRIRHRRLTCRRLCAADLVNIPPPRPKRKPLRPYPKKHSQSCELGPRGEATPDCTSFYPAAAGGSFGLAPSSESEDVNEATVAAVAAAASAAAAAAAAAVVSAAGQQVQAHLQAHPPSWFPFFGLSPSVLPHLKQGSVLEVSNGFLSVCDCLMLIQFNAFNQLVASACRSPDPCMRWALAKHEDCAPAIPRRATRIRFQHRLLAFAPALRIKDSP